MRGNEQTASLVILETSASFPKFVQELQRRGAHAIVESQASTESPRMFADRVASRLGKLAAESIVVTLAVVSTNERIDVAALTAREMLARAIVDTMREREGELILAAADHVGDDVRHHLLSLAGTLLDELGGESINVRVRFTSASQSAIRAVRPSDPEIFVGSA